MLLQIHLHVEPASQNTAGRWQIAHNPDCKKHHRVTRSRPQVGPCALGGKCPKERFPHPGSPFASSQGQAGAEREARRGERQAGRSLAQRSRPLPAALIPRRVAAAGWRALAGGTEGKTTWGLECDLGHNWACVQDRAQVCHRHSTVDKSKGRVGGLPWHPHSPVFTVGTALPPWLWESISSRRCPHVTRGQDLSRCPGVVPLQKQG